MAYEKILLKSIDIISYIWYNYYVKQKEEHMKKLYYIDITYRYTKKGEPLYNMEYKRYGTISEYNRDIAVARAVEQFAHEGWSLGNYLEIIDIVTKEIRA